MKIFIGTLLILFSHQVWAEAYCGLRDPIAMISKLYPSYENYRSIVRTIDAKTRLSVSEKLPGMPLHFGELGRHTLYVINSEKRTLGFVHVRSEQTRWGLIEVAWAILPDMTIKDYEFQRCRHSDRSQLESQDAKQFFIGKDLNKLFGFYDFNQNNVKPSFNKAINHGGDLGTSVLKCAMKTLLVTQLVWQQEILALQHSPVID